MADRLIDQIDESLTRYRVPHNVMTRVGRFTYYRLQPEVINLQAGGEPLGCEGSDRFVFADGVVVSITDEKLQGVSRGTSYIQKYVADTNGIVAYKVEVE